MDYVEKLKNNLGLIGSLKLIEPYSAKYKIWDLENNDILSKFLNIDMVKAYSGILKTSSYISRTQSVAFFVSHLNKKRDALDTLINYIQSNDLKLKNESNSNNPTSIDKKKIKRKSKLGFNLGVLKGEIGEEREL